MKKPRRRGFFAFQGYTGTIHSLTDGPIPTGAFKYILVLFAWRAHYLTIANS